MNRNVLKQKRPTRFLSSYETLALTSAEITLGDGKKSHEH